MPRVSKAQARLHHQAIESAASRLFRERGLDAVSVAEVMAEAGLTHGGFYAHYPSKDALAAAACAAAFAFAAEKWRRRIDAADAPHDALHVIAERYLDPAHCDPTVASCPTATLVTDVARTPAGHPIREAYLTGVRHQIDVLAGLVQSGNPKRDRAEACVRLATMMGALLLARATSGHALSTEFAAAARAALVPVQKRKSRVKKGGAR